MKEKWIEYKESDTPKGIYEVTEVLQNAEGTKIQLESDTYRVIIIFEFADAIRICDEGRRIKTYNECEGIQNYRKDFFGNPIYRVYNSTFNQWIIEESVGIYTNLSHYSIVTQNDLIDVISAQPPEIKVVSVKRQI